MASLNASEIAIQLDNDELQLHNMTSNTAPGRTGEIWINRNRNISDVISDESTSTVILYDGSIYQTFLNITNRANYEDSAYQNLSNDTQLYEQWNTTALMDTPFNVLNTSEDNTSVEYYDMDGSMDISFTDIMGIWVTGVFCFLGIAGNVLSFIVLVRAFGKSPMFFVLRAVSVSDAIFLFCVFLIQTLVNMYPSTGIFKTCYLYRGYIQFSVWPILMMTQMSTVWLTILVSIERYIAICFPLKSAYLLSLNRIKRAVAAVFLLSIIYNIPRYFEYEVVTADFMQKSIVGDNKFYRYLYMCIMYSIMLFLLPLALLIILNVKLVLALQQGKKQWQKLQSRQKKEQTLTIIPLTIVLVFFICATPALVVNIIDSLDPNIQDTNFIRFLVVANLLVVLNSACNFIIYCMLGKRFRSKLLELCHCEAKKKHSYRVVHQIVTSRISDV